MNLDIIALNTVESLVIMLLFSCCCVSLMHPELCTVDGSIDLFVPLSLSLSLCVCAPVFSLSPCCFLCIHNTCPRLGCALHAHVPCLAGASCGVWQCASLAPM